MPMCTSACAVERPAQPADQVHHRVEQRHGLPRFGQHADAVERAAEEGQRRDHQQRHDLQFLEAVGPQANDEAEQAEGDGGEDQEADHPDRVVDVVRHEGARRQQDQRAQQQALARGRAHVAQQHLDPAHRRAQQFVDRAGPFGHVDAEGGVGNAFAEQREHQQAGDDVGAVVDAADVAHARADGRAEDDEIQRGGEHRRDDALSPGAEGAVHLEHVDGAHGVEIQTHVRLPLSVRGPG